jgi:hypothetical protein
MELGVKSAGGVLCAMPSICSESSCCFDFKYALGVGKDGMGWDSTGHDRTSSVSCLEVLSRYLVWKRLLSPLPSLTRLYRSAEFEDGVRGLLW